MTKLFNQSINFTGDVYLAGAVNLTGAQEKFSVFLSLLFWRRL